MCIRTIRIAGARCLLVLAGWYHDARGLVGAWRQAAARPGDHHTAHPAAGLQCREAALQHEGPVQLVSQVRALMPLLLLLFV